MFDHMGLEVFWVWKKRGNNLAVLVGTTKNCQLIPSIFSNENRYNKATIVPLDTLKMAEIQPTKWHVQVLSSHTCQKLLQQALESDLGTSFGGEVGTCLGPEGIQKEATRRKKESLLEKAGRQEVGCNSSRPPWKLSSAKKGHLEPQPRPRGPSLGPPWGNFWHVWEKKNH